MKFCSKCGHEIMDEAIVCPNCGCAVVAPTTPTQVSQDDINVGLCILSALIPLFGLIYWALKYKETPKKARACGMIAIASWAICFAIIMTIFMYS